MIGIAPINTEVGDAIYGFPGTNVIATAHTCSHGDLTVKGRVVKLTDTEVIDVAEQKFRYPCLSVPTTQILSKVYL